MSHCFLDTFVWHCGKCDIFNYMSKNCLYMRVGLVSHDIRAATKCINRVSVRLVGGMVEFRRSLAASFLFRFFLLSSYQLAADAASFRPSIPDTYKSATQVCEGSI